MQQEFESVSLYDILDVTKQINYKGQIWMSIDSPFSGKLIIDLHTNYKLFAQTWRNILVDASTNEFGIPEWLCYIVRLADKQSGEWTKLSPISYNLSFPNVVWPDSSTTNVPKGLY